MDCQIHRLRPTKALNNYFVPMANAALARQVFHDINPAAGETIQQFATRLKKAALYCTYGDETENNIRDANWLRAPASAVSRFSWVLPIH